MNMITQQAIELRQQRKTFIEIGEKLGISRDKARRILLKVGVRGCLPPIPKTVKPTKEDLFWSRVDKSNQNGCWLWTRSRHVSGYGKVCGNTPAGGYAHRQAWIYTNGPIPAGMHVCHKCDNPPCCNPDHLFLGTVADNMHDRDAKGRNNKGKHIPHPGRKQCERKYCTEPECDRLTDARGLCSMHYKRLMRASGLVNW